MDRVVEPVAQPDADRAVAGIGVRPPAIGIGLEAGRGGLRHARFRRLLRLAGPGGPGAGFQLLDLGLEHARFGVELLASLDAGVVGRKFAAPLLDVALESSKLAKLAGDGGVQGRCGRRGRLLFGHCARRHQGRATNYGERRKERTGKKRL